MGKRASSKGKETFRSQLRGQANQSEAARMSGYKNASNAIDAAYGSLALKGSGAMTRSAARTQAKMAKFYAQALEQQKSSRRGEANAVGGYGGIMGQAGAIAFNPAQVMAKTGVNVAATGSRIANAAAGTAGSVSSIIANGAIAAKASADQALAFALQERTAQEVAAEQDAMNQLALAKKEHEWRMEEIAAQQAEDGLLAGTPKEKRDGVKAIVNDSTMFLTDAIDKWWQLKAEAEREGKEPPTMNQVAAELTKSGKLSSYLEGPDGPAYQKLLFDFFSRTNAGVIMPGGATNQELTRYISDYVSEVYKDQIPKSMKKNFDNTVSKKVAVATRTMWGDEPAGEIGQVENNEVAARQVVKAGEAAIGTLSVAAVKKLARTIATRSSGVKTLAELEAAIKNADTMQTLASDVGMKADDLRAALTKVSLEDLSKLTKTDLSILKAQGLSVEQANALRVVLNSPADAAGKRVLGETLLQAAETGDVTATNKVLAKVGTKLGMKGAAKLFFILDIALTAKDIWDMGHAVVQTQAADNEWQEHDAQAAELAAYNALRQERAGKGTAKQVLKEMLDTFGGSAYEGNQGPAQWFGAASGAEELAGQKEAFTKMFWAAYNAHKEEQLKELNRLIYGQ